MANYQSNNLMPGVQTVDVFKDTHKLNITRIIQDLLIGIVIEKLSYAVKSITKVAVNSSVIFMQSSETSTNLGDGWKHKKRKVVVVAYKNGRY